MDTVFVLITGSYSDREVVAVVTTEEAARDWQEGNSAERSYTEVPLDSIPD